MKGLVSKEEIKKLFDSKIKPKIAKLEVERKVALEKVVILSFAIGLLVILGVVAFPQWIELVGIFGGAIWIFQFKMVTRTYVRKFKRDVIKDVMSVLVDKSRYEPSRSIPRDIFESSNILNRSFDEFNGEDYVEGTIGNMHVAFSEISAIVVTKGEKGRKIRTYAYKGMFFVFKLPQDLKQKTLILNDVAEKSFVGNIGRILQQTSQRKGYELVQVESVNFEKEFIVYSDDQIKSRVLLRPLVLENLTIFRKRYSHPIDISICGSTLYVGIQSLKNYFEPQLFGEVIKFKEIREIYDLIMLVRDLQINLELDAA